MTQPKKIDQGDIYPYFDPKKLPAKNFRVPDYVEVREGWRAWSVAAELPRYGVPPKLYSVSWGYYWAPRRRAEAICSAAYPCSQPRKVKQHGTGEELEVTIGVPGENCSCGFYSAKDFGHLMSMGYNQYYDETNMFTIVGMVGNSGKVREGTQGWRSQYSYPLVLYCPLEAQHLAEPLQEAYAVPVKLRDVLNRGDDGRPRRPRSMAEILAAHPKFNE